MLLLLNNHKYNYYLTFFVSHFAITSIHSFWLQSPGTLHKDVGGAGTKVSEKTVGGVGTATLTTLSSINNASNTGRNKNNPVSHEVSYTTRLGKETRSSRILITAERYVISGLADDCDN